MDRSALHRTEVVACLVVATSRPSQEKAPGEQEHTPEASFNMFPPKEHHSYALCTHVLQQILCAMR